MSFDLDGYLLSLDADKLYTPGGRRALTREDPLAFALLYLPHHLMMDEDDLGSISLSQVHIDWCEYGKAWMTKAGKRESRTCFVAPRNMGKSTWLFTILPIWAAAHGHVKFAAAFSDSADQAKTHLETFRNELYTNDLLRCDFPDLCEPKRRPIDPNDPNAHKKVGQRVNESQEKIHQANDFVFWAKGMTGASLGMKVGRRRPDLIILDDIEPAEDKYGPSEIRKREVALVDKILALKEDAHVVLVGTVTRVGSLIHQLIQHELHPKSDDRQWMDEQKFKVFYFSPIVSNANGVKESVWPEKWSLQYLNSISKTRDYKKNFLNQPMNDRGDYWGMEDISYNHEFVGTRKVLTVDPATTSGRRSDHTGIAVVSCNPVDRKCCVEEVYQVKLAPMAIREFVMNILEDDEDIAGVIIEVNQGGDTWKDIMHDLPVKLLTITNSEAKRLRLTRLLTHYQRGRVFHRQQLDDLEEQMLAYTGSEFGADDMLDAVNIGVDFFLTRLTKKVDRRPSIRKAVYA